MVSAVNYYGIAGNSEALCRFLYEVRRLWRKWLDRRSHKARMGGRAFNVFECAILSPVRAKGTGSTTGWKSTRIPRLVSMGSTD
jgi:hypothetical protein